MVNGFFPSCSFVRPCRGRSCGIIIIGRKISPVQTVLPTCPCICQKILFRTGNWIKLHWCKVPETNRADLRGLSEALLCFWNSIAHCCSCALGPFSIGTFRKILSSVYTWAHGLPDVLPIWDPNQDWRLISIRAWIAAEQLVGVQ